MGKKIPLRIGRKSKRELNPLERMRKKDKDKRNLKKFITKMNQKANGEFESKVKYRRSPSPVTNDPMVGDLISTSSLRNPVTKNEPIIETEEPVVEVIKTTPSSFVPLSVISKKKNLPSEDIEESSSSEDEYFVRAPKIHATQSKNPTQNQAFYKTLLESDPKLSEFFSSISHLM